MQYDPPNDTRPMGRVPNNGNRRTQNNDLKHRLSPSGSVLMAVIWFVGILVVMWVLNALLVSTGRSVAFIVQPLLALALVLLLRHHGQPHNVVAVDSDRYLTDRQLAFLDVLDVRFGGDANALRGFLQETDQINQQQLPPRFAPRPAAPTVFDDDDNPRT